MNPPSRALGVLTTVLCLFAVLTGCASYCIKIATASAPAAHPR